MTASSGTRRSLLPHGFRNRDLRAAVAALGGFEWYYQLVHHDIWDYDNGSQPILFDMAAAVSRKAVATSAAGDLVD